MYILTPIIHSLYKYDHSTFVNTTYKFKSIDLYYKLTHYNILISIQTSKRFFRFGKKERRKEKKKEIIDVIYQSSYSIAIFFQRFNANKCEPIEEISQESFLQCIKSQFKIDSDERSGMFYWNGLDNLRSISIGKLNVARNEKVMDRARTAPGLE